MTGRLTAFGVALALLVLSAGTASAEALAGMDGNPPSGCRVLAQNGNSWAAAGCPEGTRARHYGTEGIGVRVGRGTRSIAAPTKTRRKNRDAGVASGTAQLQVSAVCRGTPEETIIENVGDTDVLVQEIVSDDPGQAERENRYEIGEAVAAGDTLTIRTGQNGDPGRERPIYANNDVANERVVVVTDTGQEFVGRCVETV